MSQQSFKESIAIEGSQVLAKVKQLVHEGNVRRIVIKQGEHTIIEVPLTVGVVGVLVAPMLAAVGALAALLTDCTIEVERVKPEEPPAVTDAEVPAQEPPSST